MALHELTQYYVGTPGYAFYLALLSVTALFSIVLACICCYQKPPVESDSELSDNDGEGGGQGGDQVDSSFGGSIARMREQLLPSIKTPPPTASIINMSPMSQSSVSVKEVQPDPFAQWSLSRSLGLTSRESLNSERSNISAATRSTMYSSTATSMTGVDTPPGTAASDGTTYPFGSLDESPRSVGLGRINFHLSYDLVNTTLTLKLICAADLPAKDFSGTSDPYVKILLLPDRKHKLQSNIRRKNLNPHWNESFAFEGYPIAKLKSKTLYLQVLDYDRFSRDDPIGEVCIPLGDDIDLVRGQTLWADLQPCKGHAGKLGELLISLCYQQATNTITVGILRARDLKAKDINGRSDPYVKVWLMYDDKKVEKKKTKTHQKTLNPTFNETFIFGVTYERIRQVSLKVSVVDYDRFGHNELIGLVVLGAKSGPAEVKHWKEMFSKPRQTIEKWHILKNFG